MAVKTRVQLRKHDLMLFLRQSVCNTFYVPRCKIYYSAVRNNDDVRGTRATSVTHFVGADPRKIAKAAIYHV